MTSWYQDPDSACSDCGHGPRWHNDPTGCTRMNASWCACTRRYAPDAAGPDDYRTDQTDSHPDHDGLRAQDLDRWTCDACTHERDHQDESEPECALCRDLYDPEPARLAMGRSYLAEPPADDEPAERVPVRDTIVTVRFPLPSGALTIASVDAESTTRADALAAYLTAAGVDVVR